MPIVLKEVENTCEPWEESLLSDRKVGDLNAESKAYLLKEGAKVFIVFDVK